MKIKQVIGMSIAASVAAAAVVVTTLSITANAEPSYVRLHLGSDAQRFVLGSQTQPLSVGKNSCALTNASLNGLIALSSTSGSSNSAPGLNGYGLGVKASPSSGNGSPCSQVDAAESLTLSRGNLLGTRTFKSVRLDLEMTGNAVVTVRLSNATTFQDFSLQTGTSITPENVDPSQSAPYKISTDPTDPIDACAAPNSSGPNSGGNDNCQWSITPSINFTTVRITTSGGTVSLEGGGDFGTGAEYDTLFELSNAAPVANNDTVAAIEDTPTSFNVLSNDTDADGTPATLTVTPTSPLPSGVTQGAGGQFAYSPPLNFNGSVSFNYTVNDGTDTSAAATVTINVAAINDPPVALNPNTSTPEETATTITVATDVDSVVINATCTVVPPTAGSVVNNGNGTVTFTPALNFVGPVTITCTIVDGSGAAATSNATVTVGVTNLNDAPTADDDTAAVNQNRDDQATTQSVLIDVLANDDDIDGPALSVAEGSITTPTEGGSAVVDGSGIRYTPADGFVGTDTFQYRASDGSASSNLATVTVTVNRVMCSEDEVSVADPVEEPVVYATFFRLTDDISCKQYTLEADAETGNVLFQPVAGGINEPDVVYRGVITLGPKPAPGDGAPLELNLEYDPTGEFDFRPVQWCDDPQFDEFGVVTGATLPSIDESWCIASETTVGSGDDDIITTWQVYGEDDPRFK